MKITIENVGVYKFAEYELSDLTVICGQNNTGKTYATYALFGFFDFFRHGHSLKVKNADIEKLITTGQISIPLRLSQKELNKYLNDACNVYSRFMPKMFSAQSKNFQDAKFRLSLDVSDMKLKDTFEETYKSRTGDVIQLLKEGDFLQCNLLVKDTDENLSQLLLTRIISEALKFIIFDDVLPDAFIASAERTGAVIFKEELDFQKNALLKYAASATDDDVDIDNIAEKIYNISYALPIRRNIDFVRKLDSITKLEGVLPKTNPGIIEYLDTLIGGVYKVSKGNIIYSPSKSSAVKLSMGESASAVRSLLLIYFYIKHVATPGDMLMIDEPELNLHPETQRKLAVLIVKLINAGIKVFVTTHSDYIIKEINTMIMLNSKASLTSINKIKEYYGYSDEDKISPESIKVYISKKHKVLLQGKTRKSTIQTLVNANIDPIFGIEADSFDETINKMNRIQKSIIFSSDE